MSSAVSPTGPLCSHLKVLAAGFKTYDIPPDFSGNSKQVLVIFVHSVFHVMHVCAHYMDSSLSSESETVC